MKGFQCSSLLVLVLVVMIFDICIGRTRKHDVTLTQYTDSGEVAQLQYASRAVDMANVSEECGYAILFSVRKKPSKLVVVDNTKILENYGDFFVAMTGLAADCNSCRSYCNRVKVDQTFMYGEVPTLSYFSKTLTKWLTRGMYLDEGEEQEATVVRPLATAVLLSGVEDGRLRLVQLGCSGSVSDCVFSSLGDASLPGQKVTLRKIQELLMSSNRDKDKSSARGEGDSALDRAFRDVKSITELLLDAETEENGDVEHSTGAAVVTDDGDIDEVDAERRSTLLMDCAITTLTKDGKGIGRSVAALVQIGPFSSTKRLQSLLSQNTGNR